MKAKYAQIQSQGGNMPMGVFGGGPLDQADSKSVHEADVVQPKPQPLELPAWRDDR